MKKNIPFIVLLSLISIISLAQSSKPNYLVKQNQDTVACSSIEESRNGGNVTLLNYVDASGKRNEIKGKANCEEVKTYCINGQSYDLIPLKASKPDGYQRHMWRKIDGRIKVYDYANQIDNGQIGEEYNYVTVVKYVALLPDGKYYDINKKNIENYIKPEVMKCEGFKNGFKGNFSEKPKEFDAMIKLYNESCK